MTSITPDDATPAGGTFDPLYYAAGNRVFKRPVSQESEPGWTKTTIGFPVCVATEYVGEEGAKTIAEMLSRADTTAPAALPTAETAAGESDAGTARHGAAAAGGAVGDVPREPTLAMLQAGYDVLARIYPPKDNGGAAIGQQIVWEAMWDAAIPATPTGATQPIPAAGGREAPFAWGWLDEVGHHCCHPGSLVAFEKARKIGEASFPLYRHPAPHAGEAVGRRAGVLRADDGWQPIKTAPRDGSPVLCLTRLKSGPEYNIGHFDEGAWWSSEGADIDPGQWCPLPPADAIRAEADRPTDTHDARGTSAEHEGPVGYPLPIHEGEGAGRDDGEPADSFAAHLTEPLGTIGDRVIGAGHVVMSEERYAWLRHRAGLDGAGATVGVSEPRGIYIASKTVHAPRWRQAREAGVPIISTWIDEAGPGETADFTDLWRRCIAEAVGAAALILYREDGEVLKGAWAEAGAALACGVPVFAVGIREGGFSIAHAPGMTHCQTIEEASRLAILARHDQWKGRARPTPAAGAVTEAVRDVLAERRRQVEAEGWTPEHDDAHAHGELALAASAYAYVSAAQEAIRKCFGRPSWWPWDATWWKPTSRRRDLVKACALGLAEIERLDRKAALTPDPSTKAETPGGADAGQERQS